MSPEVSFPAAYKGRSIGDYCHPLLNADAVPFACAADSRPNKRLRVAANDLSCVEIGSAGYRHSDRLGSARSLNGSYPPRQVNNLVEEREQQRPQSVPPPSRRGRKKKSKQNPHNGSWIQESFAFPAQQTWLKVKPRHRKVAVEVEAVKTVTGPSSAALDAGETLCLDKHADRIAALIARKRQENESKLFRERMSVQQRLHRGEADHNDRLMAASHDELKRKMELSAKGIFEEHAPNGKEPALKIEGRPPAPSPTSSRASSVASVASTVPTSPTPALLETEDGDNEASQVATDESDIDEELPRHTLNATDDLVQVKPTEPFIPQASQQPPTMVVSSAYAPYEQPVYSQIQTTVTTQASAFSAAPNESYTTQFFLTQPRFTNQRYHNPNLCQSQPEQGPMSHQWTSQMFQALPSTANPVLETNIVPMATQHPTVDEQHDAAFDPFGSSTNTDAYGYPRSSILHSDDASEQPQAVVLGSNVNIFTRQARENGVIGGNNNYLDIGGEGGKRRNMFDSWA